MNCNVLRIYTYWYGFIFQIAYNLYETTSCQVLYSIKEEYPQLSENSIKIFLFPTTYLCESQYSLYHSTKKTY